MVLKIKSDYGTLQCSFNGIDVWFCDNKSNELFESLCVRLSSVYGDKVIDFILIDLVSLKVLVYEFGSMSAFTSVALQYFFKYDCDLLRFVNLFARKKLTFVDGLPSYIPNRNYLRLSLHSK